MVPIKIDRSDFNKVKFKNGIYAIVNTSSSTKYCKLGKPYVGQCLSGYGFPQRFRSHLNRLNANYSHSGDNTHLKAAWSKYGPSSFSFFILEFVKDKEKITEREEYWIQKFKSNVPSYGYNKRKAANSNVGVYYAGLSLNRVHELVRKFHKIHNAYPLGKTSEISDGYNWKLISRFLGTIKKFQAPNPLAKFLSCYYGVYSNRYEPKYTNKEIAEWSDKFLLEHGRYPNTKSGIIKDVFSIYNYKDTWFRLNYALKNGLRGYTKACNLKDIQSKYCKYWIEKYQYDKAKEVVQKLKIKTQRDYFKRSKIDPKLPSYPDDFYQIRGEWISWPSFLGRSSLVKQIGVDKYSTYEEAKIAARKLGINTSGEYRTMFRYDSSLPYQPYKIYENDWISWASFLRD